MNPLDVALDQLVDIVTHLTVVHNRAWWPGTGTIAESRVTANTTRVGGPILEPGDTLSMERYHDFLTDLNTLRADLAKTTGKPPPRTRLRVDTAPAKLAYEIDRVSESIRWLRVHGANEETVGSVAARVDRLIAHQEAILSRPKVPVSVPCRNAGERDLCTQWAINNKSRLCRSCENARDHQRRRARRRTTRSRR